MEFSHLPVRTTSSLGPSGKTVETECCWHTDQIQRRSRDRCDDRFGAKQTTLDYSVIVPDNVACSGRRPGSRKHRLCHAFQKTCQPVLSLPSYSHFTRICRSTSRASGRT